MYDVIFVTLYRLHRPYFCTRFIIDNFGIAGISTVDEDLKILGIL